jgi:hypothetical protein
MSYPDHTSTETPDMSKHRTQSDDRRPPRDSKRTRQAKAQTIARKQQRAVKRGGQS